MAEWVKEIIEKALLNQRVEILMRLQKLGSHLEGKGLKERVKGVYHAVDVVECLGPCEARTKELLED